jgi:hypothetical protein
LLHLLGALALTRPSRPAAVACWRKLRLTQVPVVMADHRTETQRRAYIGERRLVWGVFIPKRRHEKHKLASREAA